MFKTSQLLAMFLILAATITSTGCLHSLLATGVYLWEGGNTVPAACDDLKDQRVVVACRCPSSSAFSFAGTSDQLARQVSNLLRENVSRVDVVDYTEVDQWFDENGRGDYQKLARAVKADRLLLIDLAHFDLYKGKTLYQGNSDVRLTVYDLTQPKSKTLWEKEVGEVLYPRNSAIPAQDKSPKQFQREYVGILANKIGVFFYKHDPHADFALDAMANR